MNHTWAPSITSESPTIQIEKGTQIRNRTIPITRTIPIYPIHAVRRYQYCFLKAVDLIEKIYTDQTGRFPITSRKGNKYILVAYHYDSNTIHEVPLKMRTGLELKTTYHKLHSLLTKRGLKHIIKILDNEYPYVPKKFMKEANEKFQLVPTHIHCRNIAEWSIRTFKEHFISG